MNYGILVAICLFFVGGQCADPHAQPWDYNSLGRDWQGICSKGRRQSPIALSLQEASFDSKLGELKFTYDSKTQGKYKNNGHSIAFVVTGNKTSKLSAGGLKEEYTFHSLHFHWGLGDCEGSEHVIDYTRFPLELHMVHFNTKYGSLEAAKTKHDGIAVLGILFTAVKDVTKVSKLGKFLSDEYGPMLGQLIIPNATIADKTVNMASYVEDLAVSNKFFRYQGSLTTPTCDETVTWTVMITPLGVDPALLAKFREIKLDNTAKTEHKTGVNYRAIQKTNGRVVSSNDKAAGVASILVPNQLVLLILTIAATKFSY